MKKYLIDSAHIATLDSFENGEQDQSHYHEIKAHTTNAINPMQAIKKYFENVLYLPFNSEFLDNEDGFIRYTNIVTNDNNHPTDRDFNMWKKGETDLYSLHTTIYIYELKEVSANELM